MMRNLSRVVFGMFVLAILLVTLVFILENQQPVTMMFLGWAAPALPASVFVVAALLLGLIVGPSLAWIVTRRTRK